MKVTGMRVLLAVVAFAAIVFAVLVVVRRDPYRPGTTHQVTINMGPGPTPCANPAPLFLDGRAWGTDGMAPASWAGGSAHDGRLDIVDVDQGVFTAADDPGVTIRFHRAATNFSDLRCAIS